MDLTNDLNIFEAHLIIFQPAVPQAQAEGESSSKSSPMTIQRLFLGLKNLCSHKPEAVNHTTSKSKF